MIIEKIEVLYWLYLFGMSKQVLSMYPFVTIPKQSFIMPLSFEDFKVEFSARCKEWSYTEDEVYEKCRNTILFLHVNGVFSFQI